MKGHALHLACKRTAVTGRRERPLPVLNVAIGATRVNFYPLFFTGPRDDEFAGRKFSFVRYSSICAVIPNSEAYEEAARNAGALQDELEKAAGAGNALKFR